MKRFMLVVLILLPLVSICGKESRKDSLALGLKLEETNDDLGISLEVVSPKFFKFLNVKLSGGFVFDMGENSYNSEGASNSRSDILLGLRGGNQVNDFMSLYGEFGMLTIKDQDFNFGIYGLFGFQFFTAEEYKSPISYFIELGTKSLGVHSGFSTCVGLRYHF